MRTYERQRGRMTGRISRYTPVERRIPPALGSVISKLQYDEIAYHTCIDSSRITDCKYVASYNLTDKHSKKIFVPGRPPIWTPMKQGCKLESDQGEYYRDDNAARFPQYPLEPLTLAIHELQPTFDFSSIDIVACGSTLGNLLRFASSEASAFSFTVQVIGKTACFLPRDLSPTELIQGVVGYGNTFVEINTSWSSDMKGSSSHQRVISYDLGGHKMLVRFETDAYMMGPDEEKPQQRKDSTVESSLEQELAGLLKSRKVENVAAESEIVHKGCVVPQETLIDIKTRTFRTNWQAEKALQLPRLWIRQIPFMVLSLHDRGVFQPPEVEDLSEDVRDWELENQAVIARLAAIIADIKEAASVAKGHKLEVRCNTEGATSLQYHELSLEELGDWEAMPQHLQSQWTE